MAVLLLLIIGFAPTPASAEESDEQPSTEGATDPSAREISGVLVDLAGFPVSNARVTVGGLNLWRGPRTDAAGRFKVTAVPAEAKLLLAWSQRSKRMAAIPISAEMPDDRRYRLDLRESAVEGRLLDRNGKAVEGATVTFHVKGPGGLGCTQAMWQPTNAEGEIRDWQLPGGPGWTISASLASGEATDAIAINDPVVDLPDLVQRALAGPGAKDAPKMAVYSGRVADEKGAPIPGVNIEFFGHGVGARTNADGRWSRRMRVDLQRLEIRLDHPEFVSWEFDLRQITPPRHALLDGSAVQVMKRGLRLTGTVRDPSRAPIGNALVLAAQFYATTPGPESEPIEDSTAVRTARDGSFSVGGIPPGLRHVVVLAEGFAPARTAVTVNEQTKPLEIVLDQGRTVTGRVVDEEGNPIANVRVGANDWNMAGSYRHSLSRVATTGSDGRFAFVNLPRQGSIECYVSGRRQRLSLGFEILAGVDDVGALPLYPNPVIAGKVVDDETGEPITSFLLAEGHLDDEGRFLARGDAIRLDTASAEFERTIDWMIIHTGHEVPFAVKIWASGYAAAMTPPVVPGQARQHSEVRLKRAASVRGVVKTPDGKPAGGTRVFFVESDNDTWVTGTSLNESLTYTPDVRATAKDDGSFEIPAQDHRGRLLFLHDAGYAIVRTFGFQSGQNTTLIPWARIEGSYRPGGKARSGVTIVAEAIRPLASSESRDRLVFSLSTTTDEAGRFVIEHVPSMQLRIGAQAGFGYAAAKTVQIEHGRTNVVRLADEGPRVTGRVDLAEVIAANPPAPGLEFDTSTSWIRAVRILPRPEIPDGADPADWDEQIRLFGEGKASKDLTLPALFAELRPDGSFGFDALVPGKYALLIEVHGERPPNTCGWGLVLARGRAEFTVADAVVALPSVKLEVLAHPVAGRIAPEISGTTDDGEAFTLSGLRGKYVVLDFWAGWCAPCRASQPALQALHKKYEEKVSFVGLNFDYSETTAKRAMASIKSPWPQVLAGPWGTENAVLGAYGVESIPSLWLIDPEGKIVAKQITVEGLDGMLAKLPRK
jgi:thiol-disulfide isomerase/thioredoxin/protocatechuate 3,4-dioxygenase beta subunit